MHPDVLEFVLQLTCGLDTFSHLNPRLTEMFLCAYRFTSSNIPFRPHLLLNSPGNLQVIISPSAKFDAGKNFNFSPNRFQSAEGTISAAGVPENPAKGIFT